MNMLVEKDIVLSAALDSPESTRLSHLDLYLNLNNGSNDGDEGVVGSAGPDFPWLEWHVDVGVLH